MFCHYFMLCEHIDTARARAAIILVCISTVCVKILFSVSDLLYFELLALCHSPFYISVPLTAD